MSKQWVLKGLFSFLLLCSFLSPHLCQREDILLLNGVITLPTNLCRYVILLRSITSLISRAVRMSVCLLSELNLDLDEVMLLLLLILRVWSQVGVLSILYLFFSPFLFFPLLSLFYFFNICFFFAEKQPPKTSSHHRLKILSRHVTAATPSTAIADTSTSTSTITIY